MFWNKQIRITIPIVLLTVVIATYLAFNSFLVFIPKSIKIGKVENHVEKEISFTVNNFSIKSINIIDYEASCDCVNLNFSKRQIPPFKTSKVTIKMIPSQIGYFRRLVVINSTAKKTYGFVYIVGETIEGPVSVN